MRINSVDPGFTATDFNDYRGALAFRTGFGWSRAEVVETLSS
jgi:hypothetical protein